MAQAQTLQEYLVSIRYVVDSGSQNNFLQGLAKAALGTKGLAIETGLLVAGILKLSEMLADAGEKLYWMGQRLGSSVQDITDFTFAMSNLGMSSGQAAESLEQFSDWTQRMGPAANSFLRMLGDTADDTVDQFKGLGDVFRRLGGTREFQHGTAAQRQQFAVALAWAASIPGMTKQMMLDLSSGDWQKFIDLQDKVRNSIGLNKRAMEAYAASSLLVATKFRELGMLFEASRTKFALTFNTAMAPVLERLFNVIQQHMPAITRLLDLFAKALAFIVSMAAAAVDVIGRLVEGFEAIYDFLGKLAPGLDIVKDALIGFGLALMASPIGRFIYLISTLLLLMEDYEVHRQHGITALNWDWLDKLSANADAFTGVAHSLEAIAAALTTIVGLKFGADLLRFFGLLRAVPAVGAVAGAAGAAGAGAAGAAGAGLLGTAAIAAIAIALADYLWNKAKESGWDPGSKEHSPVGWGEQAGAATRAWVREHILGLPPEAPTPETPATPTTTRGGPAPPLITNLPGAQGADVGTRANNPGNMDYSDWMRAFGATGRTQYQDQQTGATHTMAVFSSIEQGTAATIEWMRRNQAKPGHGMTLQGALQGYAENSYIGTLARQLGIDANTTPFDITKVSPEQLAKLLKGQMGQEGRSISSGALTDAKIQEAIRIARAGPSDRPPTQVAERQPAGPGWAETLERWTRSAFAPSAQAAEPHPTSPAAPTAPQTAPDQGVLDRLRRWSEQTFYNHPAAAAAVDRAIQPAPLLPAGASRQGADAAAGGRHVVLNQQTTVQVAPGPTAHDTAASVARAQGRVNETLVRNSAGIIR